MMNSYIKGISRFIFFTYIATPPCGSIYINSPLHFLLQITTNPSSGSIAIDELSFLPMQLRGLISHDIRHAPIQIY